MSAIDSIVSANASYAEQFAGSPERPPKRRLTIITCMDARLDLFGALGLAIGDAHILRNAGGVVTPDVLRSLAISQRALGTREVALLHHTDCGMLNFDDHAFGAELATETGVRPDWNAPGWTDVRADIRAALEAVRTCPWLPHRGEVRGFVYDVATGSIDEVD